MTIRELMLRLRQEPFEPFEIVTSSGSRYPVRHPELAQLTPRGAVYIFQPLRDEAVGTAEGPDVVSLLHVTALEPIREARGSRS